MGQYAPLAHPWRLGSLALLNLGIAATIFWQVLGPERSNVPASVAYWGAVHRANELCAGDAAPDFCLRTLDGLGEVRLSDLRGELLIRDQRIVFKEVSSKTLDGTLALTGELNTGGPRNEFDMDLGIRGCNISQTFASVAFCMLNFCLLMHCGAAIGCRQT